MKLKIWLFMVSFFIMGLKCSRGYAFPLDINGVFLSEAGRCPPAAESAGWRISGLLAKYKIDWSKHRYCLAFLDASRLQRNLKRHYDFSWADKATTALIMAKDDDGAVSYALSILLKHPDEANQAIAEHLRFLILRAEAAVADLIPIDRTHEYENLLLGMTKGPNAELLNIPSFLADYPNSSKRNRVLQIDRQMRERYFESISNIASYYANRGHWLAALDRFRGLLKVESDSPHVAKLLYEMFRCLVHLRKRALSAPRGNKREVLKANLKLIYKYNLPDKVIDEQPGPLSLVLTRLNSEILQTYNALQMHFPHNEWTKKASRFFKTSR